MLALKRSYIVLLIGVGTLVAGSVVLGVNSSVLATDFLTNNLVIKKATIAAGEQYETDVTSQTEGTTSVLIRGQPFNNQVQTSIFDEDGKAVFKDTLNGDYIATLRQSKDKHTKL